LKKEKLILDDVGYIDDYKMERAWEETRLNFESTEKWLYLGADAVDSTFAKVGLTKGDLSSRSYSSARPDYYLFCAFKCRYDLPMETLRSIEFDILTRLQDRHRYSDGTTKRRRHFESGNLSECFYDVNFTEFFMDYHFEIYNEYRSSFVISGVDDGFGGSEGEFVDCIFNRKVPGHHRYKRMIVQY
jgi:hypothetical protein